ncbi:MAG: flagellar protein FlaG [Halanaerobium sp.]|nr:flagellar protein FlaG [Halanaerobium sp.]
MPGIEKISQGNQLSRINPVKKRVSDEKEQAERKNGLSNKKLSEAIEKKVEDLNDIVDLLGRGIKFKLHKKTDFLMTQIIDVKTREVLKEMPPEEMLDLIARIEEMVGIIIDEKV